MQNLSGEFEGGVDNNSGASATVDGQPVDVELMTGEQAATEAMVPLTNEDFAIFTEGEWQLTEAGLIWPNRDVTEAEAERAGRGIARIEKASRYAIGDYLRGLQHRFGEKYTAIAERVGLKPRFLSQLVYMTGKVPVENRLLSPSVSHSRAVAQFEPDKQATLLQVAATKGEDGGPMKVEALEQLAKQAKKDWSVVENLINPPTPTEGEQASAAAAPQTVALDPFIFRFRAREPKEKLDDYIAKENAAHAESFRRYYDKKYDAAQAKVEEAAKEQEKVNKQRGTVLELVNTLPEAERPALVKKLEKAKDVDAINAVRAAAREVQKAQDAEKRKVEKVQKAIGELPEDEREQFTRMLEDGQSADTVEGKMKDYAAKKAEDAKTAEKQRVETARADIKRKQGQAKTKRDAAKRLRDAGDEATAQTLEADAAKLDNEIATLEQSIEKPKKQAKTTATEGATTTGGTTQTDEPTNTPAPSSTTTGSGPIPKPSEGGPGGKGNRSGRRGKK
jgi:hypothetical protein